MRTLLAILPGLVCAGGMVLCMTMMGRGRSRSATSDTAGDEPGGAGVSHDEQLADLREEVTRLRAELRDRDRDDVR